MILDTNILIEILKDNEFVISKLEICDEEFKISSISAMELYYGAINKKELNELKKYIKNFEVIEIDEEISKLSTNLIFQYAKSHNLTIPDSLIASTSMVKDEILFTLNLKDFKYIEGIKLFNNLN